MTASSPDSPALQRGLGVLVALTTMALLQLHLWPRRPDAPIPSQMRLPGVLLPSYPGKTTAVASLSPTLRRQLSQGMELRLTNLESRHPSGLQVAALTSSMPNLRLQRRRLLADQVAFGQLQGRSALQTCVIGRHHAVTASALQELTPHAIANAPLLLQGWLGLRPKPVSSCLLVTLVQEQQSAQQNKLDLATMMRELDAFLLHVRA